MEITKMKRNQLFRQVAIMEVNLHVFAQIVAKKNRLVNLDTEIWGMVILEINLGVKLADNKTVC